MTSERAHTVGTALAVTSVGSVQFGAALAATLFPRVGPLGTVTLRLIGAALALSAVTRPWRVSWTRPALRSAAVFGCVLVLMNVSLYLAIDRLPLATVITLEFLGPLGVSVATGTGWRHRGWAVPAGVGVALLGGGLHVGDGVGVLAALTAALCWASYILLSRRMGTGADGLAGLCLASVLGAVVMLPVGLLAAGGALVRPSTLALGLTVGLVSSAIPYSLDLLALRRLPTAVFGVLTSLNPAVAAVAGLLVLGERLPQQQLVGIAFVIAASGGITLSSRRPAAVSSAAVVPESPPIPCAARAPAPAPTPR
ncbi:MAG: inner rane transporter RhtA [Frankiales bacterium]|nr:inner rane transporter RhtA [Frankiales bacterium]